MSSELGLIFVAGLLGSSHCVGMCGGFAMLVSLTSRPAWRGLGRQCLYSCGRIFTYAVLGAIAGLMGHRVATLRLATSALQVGAVLCVVAGVVLVVEGLKAAGFTWRRRASGIPSGGVCLAKSLFANFLQARGLHSTFLAGVLTGFLPCGLVYAFLALAAARMHPLEGSAVMTAFGLGTIPLMVLTGVGGSCLSLAGRRRLLRAAAWCVVVTGVLTIVRGAGFLRSSVASDRPACPFCAAEAVPAGADPR